MNNYRSFFQPVNIYSVENYTAPAGNNGVLRSGHLFSGLNLKLPEGYFAVLRKISG